jgi:hypothetical protein
VMVGPAAYHGLTLPELLGLTTPKKMAGPISIVTEKTKKKINSIFCKKENGKGKRKREKVLFCRERERSKHRLGFAFVSLLWRF